jgi:hypothetical protein
MCLSCGCGLPDDDHDNPDHITHADLAKAAAAAGITLDEAAANIAASVGIRKDRLKAARRQLRGGTGRD